MLRMRGLRRKQGRGEAGDRHEDTSMFYFEALENAVRGRGSCCSRVVLVQQQKRVRGFLWLVLIHNTDRQTGKQHSAADRALVTVSLLFAMRSLVRVCFDLRAVCVVILVFVHLCWLLAMVQFACISTMCVCTYLRTSKQGAAECAIVRV
jgi:hypothetical protein